jgi:hypothetical protein
MAMIIYARNIITGKISPVRQKDLDHPVLGKNLVKVDEEAKPYIPEMYKPKEEASEMHTRISRRKKDD